MQQYGLFPVQDGLARAQSLMSGASGSFAAQNPDRTTTTMGPGPTLGSTMGAAAGGAVAGAKLGDYLSESGEDASGWWSVFGALYGAASHYFG